MVDKKRHLEIDYEALQNHSVKQRISFCKLIHIFTLKTSVTKYPMYPDSKYGVEVGVYFLSDVPESVRKKGKTKVGYSKDRENK